MVFHFVDVPAAADAEDEAAIGKLIERGDGLGRDDRLVLYGDATKDTGTFVYRVRATNGGVFQTPPAFAEGMYNRTVVGLSKAGRLEIVKP